MTANEGAGDRRFEQGQDHMVRGGAERVEGLHAGDHDPIGRAPELDLLSRHRDLIEKSGIDSSIARERGYRSVSKKTDLRALGFSDRQCRVPALLIPVRDVRGEIATYQCRPDDPRVLNGRVVKYETPIGSRMILDVPLRVCGRLGDPHIDLFITEGARKADAAVSIGLCAVALLGVWNWRGTNQHGGKTALPDWESVATNDRSVFIVFDSDVMTKHAVHAALVRLKSFLESRGSKVSVIYLPCGSGGAKVGLDDYLAQGHTVGDLLRLASTDLRPAPDASDRGHPAQPPRYEARPEGLVLVRSTADGDVPVLLTNFVAKIEANVIQDDGATQASSFRIVATCGDRSITVAVPATEFGAMNWPLEQIGVDAIVMAGAGIRDHARVAMLTLSGSPARETVYTHTGWRKLGDAGWGYLHSAGAIGAKGPIPGIQVSLPTVLAHARLPDPIDGDRLVRAARIALNLFDLAPERIVLPILAAVMRAVLGGADLSVHLAGSSGIYKTAIAGVFQSFHGAGFSGDRLPCSWSSTANALETVAFIGKDMLLTVDDFAPSGSRADVQRIHRDAERLLRAQGNQRGRMRLDSSAQLQSAKAPRGVILSTGEDVPAGHSLRARIVTIELKAGDVRVERLSECQRHAKDGVYATLLAGYVRHLAQDIESTQRRIEARVTELRARPRSANIHARTPSNLAQLEAALEPFFEFLVVIGAITPAEQQEFGARSTNALSSLAVEQAEHLQSAEPVDVFLHLLRSAISSGRAHIADRDDHVPTENASALGWTPRASGSGVTTWEPGGLCCGWRDADDLYLDPHSAITAAELMSNDTDRFTLTARTLSKRLNEKRLLKTIDVERKRLTVRRAIKGARKDVLHTSVSILGLSSLSSPTSPEHQRDDDADSDDPSEGTIHGDENESSQSEIVPDERPWDLECARAEELSELRGTNDWTFDPDESAEPVTERTNHSIESDDRHEAPL